MDIEEVSKEEVIVTKGNKIAEMMKAKGVTIQQIRETQGVSLATVYNWVNNQHQPTLSKLYDIAEQLECCIHHIIHPSPPPLKNN